MYRVWYYLISLVAVLGIVACESQKPSYVLSNGDMEDVLYDIHRAHFSFERENDSRENGAQQYALFQNVLKKHDVTQAEWDSSIVYYCRHTDELEKIYLNINDRLTYEASVIGASVGESNDTTDIWREEKNMLLTSIQPFTTQQWSIKTDTLLKAGEQLSLKFTALFARENARKNATCLIALRLGNDSIIKTQQMMNRTGIYDVNISDTEDLGIKEVMGLFMMQRDLGYSTALRSSDKEQILSIRDICLVHKLPENKKNKNIEKQQTTETTDSTESAPATVTEETAENSAIIQSDKQLPLPPNHGQLKVKRIKAVN